MKEQLTAPILVSNAALMVLQIIRRRGAVSRSTVTEITGWSKAKTTQEIRILLEKEYLVEVGNGASQGGRKPKLLKLNPDLGYLLGVDIGVTSLDMALTDIGGEILVRFSEPVELRKGPEVVLDRVTEIALEMLGEVGGSANQILGIVIGVPGPVNFIEGVLVAPPLIPEWERFQIRSYLKKTFVSTFVMVDNDVNIMALGERFAGEAQGINHFIFVKIGTGIGAGIMSNGKIHRGRDGCAGDIGHICVDKRGPLCNCGNFGCLEIMAAGPAIAKRAMDAAENGESALMAKMMDDNGGYLTPEDVNKACLEADSAALQVIRESGRLLGETLASLVNFFNPSHIIIGGGISQFGNHLLVAIRQTILKRSLPLATKHLVINFSSAGPDAGVIGAISMASEYLFAIEEDPGRIIT